MKAGSIYSSSKMNAETERKISTKIAVFLDRNGYF